MRVVITGRNLAFLCVLLLGVLALQGCASHETSAVTERSVSAVSEGSDGADAASMQADDEFEDYDEEDEEPIADPWEPWNRFWFDFNDTLLLKVIKPVYNGYDAVMPDPFQRGLSNFCYNLKAPIRIVNRLLQGEFAQMWVEIGRFVVNSTLGGGGLFDVVSREKVLVPYSDKGADFGTTLATWGFGEGIYIVWPFFGPSTVRDTFGMAGDEAASPFFWGSRPIGPVRVWATTTTDATLRFNNIGSTIETYESLVNSAVEPYSAVRDAYVKSRRIR